MADPERQRGLLNRAGDRSRMLATVLEPERELGADGPHHDLCLRILEQRPDELRQFPGPVLARVVTSHDGPPRERAAVKMRNEAACHLKERRFPGTRAPRND